MAGDKKRKRTGVMEAKEAEKVKEVEKPKAESKEEKQESRPKRTKQKVERYFDKKEKTQETGTSIQSTGPPNSKSEKKKNKRRARPIYVLKISSIPYGFFEKQLLKYFLQFGQVIRVRVSRNKKTGNHRGWAYVGFDDKTVAEIAAETMDGYLMFNKRLSCRVGKLDLFSKNLTYSRILIFSRRNVETLAFFLSNENGKNNLKSL
ncbi:hypothetical protein WR25_00008 isoform B [Diploscapter pachys]|uniref:RRM domain-containing protein n=1 Tax=Diploscapter pachys TaxID=2018661 RepID=A0A2A2KE66_9BILA|nr:hypothetical protein WR25_00008 isoform B [Diploscapter pachys]